MGVYEISSGSERIDLSEATIANILKMQAIKPRGMVNGTMVCGHLTIPIPEVLMIFMALHPDIGAIIFAPCACCTS